MKKKKIIIISISCAIAISAISGTTYAWLNNIKSGQGNFTPGSLKDSCELDVYFLNDSNHVEATNYISNGVVVCDGTNKVWTGSEFVDNNKENSIKNFRVDININSPIAAYFRVKVLYNIILERTLYADNKLYSQTGQTVQAGSDSTFNVAENNKENWYFDKDTRYYYYSEPLEKNTDYNISFISGGKFFNANTTSILFYENYVYNVSVEVEVVQANRYKEYWGIESIPEGNM